MPYSLQAEIQAEALLSHDARAAQYQFPALGPLTAMLDQQQRVENLRTMEGDTRFMPNTRQALETQSLTPSTIPTILFELEEHIARIRPNHPYLADHRSRRLALFRLNPSLQTLRAIWLLKEKSSC